LGEASEKVRARVEAAREKQLLRFVNSGLATSAALQPGKLRLYCKLGDAGMALMRSAMSQPQLSARRFHRVLKLARTIADLEDSLSIQPAQLAEALQYRRRRQN
jgi:magnesium chelatase family protein